MLDSGRFTPTPAELLDHHGKVVRACASFPLNLRFGGVLECLQRPVPLRLHDTLFSLALPHGRMTCCPVVSLTYEPLTGRTLFVLIDWLDEARAQAAGIGLSASFDTHVRHAPAMFDEDLLRRANSVL
ncbi:MAG: hypothetical protein AAFR93_11960 [Pseudomonadota bacterium]